MNTTMTPVSTTPTSLDKLEVIRKMNQEIVTLTSVKELALNAARSAESAAEEAKGRKDALDAAIKGLEATVGGISAEVSAFLQSCRESLQKAVGDMESVTRIIKGLSEKIEGLTSEITALIGTRDQIVTNIANENELMDRQRRDLDIYHKRILAAAEKFLPGQKITI